jgi:hypothetical protein
MPIPVEQIRHHAIVVEVELDVEGPTVDAHLPELGADGQLAVGVGGDSELVLEYKFEARGQLPADPDAAPPWASFAGTPTVKAIDSDGLAHTPRLTGRRFVGGADGDGGWQATLSGSWTFVPRPPGRLLRLTVTVE